MEISKWQWQTLGGFAHCGQVFRFAVVPRWLSLGSWLLLQVSVAMWVYLVGQIGYSSFSLLLINDKLWGK
jgi:hypothetical protein